jgi:hypothetical protein
MGSDALAAEDYLIPLVATLSLSAPIRVTGTAMGAAVEPPSLAIRDAGELSSYVCESDDKRGLHRYAGLLADKSAKRQNEQSGRTDFCSERRDQQLYGCSRRWRCPFDKSLQAA